jgi:hypothetical protein
VFLTSTNRFHASHFRSNPSPNDNGRGTFVRLPAASCVGVAQVVPVVRVMLVIALATLCSVLIRIGAAVDMILDRAGLPVRRVVFGSVLTCGTVRSHDRGHNPVAVDVQSALTESLNFLIPLGSVTSNSRPSSCTAESIVVWYTRAGPWISSRSWPKPNRVAGVRARVYGPKKQLCRGRIAMHAADVMLDSNVQIDYRGGNGGPE